MPVFLQLGDAASQRRADLGWLDGRAWQGQKAGHAAPALSLRQHFTQAKLSKGRTMAVSAQYLAFVLDQLAQVRAVRSRRMFGGAGFYAGEAFFAVADDDTLFFKVDDSTRPDYVAEGMKPFQPMGPDSPVMNGYYEVPARVLEDGEELAAWMKRAIDVALRAGTRKRSRRTPPGAN
jgi:DNA transformation protein